MQRISLIFLFLFLSLTSCYSNQENIKEKVETVEDSYTWDFGQVRQGEILKHTFIFKNETSKTIGIKEINTSCGCTASKAKKKRLLPQEETSIEVSFDSADYLGPNRQFIYVDTDDLDKPVIRYIIKAEVVK